MQFANYPTYKHAPLHVVPDAPEDPDSMNYYKTDCGRTLSAHDAKLQIIPWPDPNKPRLNSGTLIICDKCWFKQDPNHWKVLRALGCVPRSQFNAKKYEEKSKEIDAKEATK